MKSILPLLAIMVLGAGACAPQLVRALPPVLSTATAGTTPSSQDWTPAEKAAISSLAQSLGVSPTQIEVVAAEAVTWPNGCMGVQRLGVMCTNVQVRGFRIVLRVNGREYEFHTNQDGSQVIQAVAAATAGPAETAARDRLASNLGISPGEVQVVSSAPVEWPDSCLGVALEGIMCSQIVTPGHLIVLQAAGRQFEYHANQDGSSIMPATLAMTWKEQGGIAGVCEGITVYASGEVFGLDCRPNGKNWNAVLTESQRAQLDSWLDRYAMTTIDLSDPGHPADGMTRLVDLYGKGSVQPDPSTRQSIFDFGENLYKTSRQ